MNRVISRLGFTAVALVAGSALYAQGTQTASVTGRVVDPSGAAVAGASVRLSSPSLQLARTLITGSDGSFVTRLLPPGVYTIEISKDTFQTARFTQQLGIDQNYQPKIVLQTVATQTVEVIATANPLVDKTDVKTAANYTMSDVDKLPSGRTMDTVALLTPGVTGGVGGRVQMRGAMTSGNLFLVDGQNVADNAYNNRGVTLIDDAVDEIQVLTGAISAEYGDVDGGVINAVTKSGSNDFHGLIRWNLTNSAWNAVRPYQTRPNNTLNELKTAALGGYFLKDRIWFFASYFSTNSSTPGAISGASLAVPGAVMGNYDATVNEIRRDFKLTFALTENQSIVASYANSQNQQGNRNYSAGEIAALVPQANTSEYWNVAWRGLWTSAFSTDVRYGEKKQRLSAGSLTPGVSPIYSNQTGLFYQNGIFDSSDGGDNRNNKTFGAKGSLFIDWKGQHQIDFGLDYSEGIDSAKNAQSVTGLIFQVSALDLVAQTAKPRAIWTYQTVAGQATNSSYGIYANDKWSINEHLTAQLGLRFDKYKAVNDQGQRSAGATGFSPRLGVKYDIFGDSQWLLGASFSRYNGKVLDGFVNAVTNQGNPNEIDYKTTLPNVATPLATVLNPANYDYSGAGIVYVNLPTLATRLSDDLKAPHADEFQLSAAYSFNWEPLGQGFVSLTAVQKEWGNLIDYRAGNDGTVLDPTGTPIYLKVYYNSPDAKRKYQGLEFATQLTHGAWNVTGGITWSSLKGNYEGEGGNTPARGEGLAYFTVQNGVQMYSNTLNAPYGYLAGHEALRMRWQADRTVHSQFGDTTIGFIYRFDSGSHYSDTRNLTNDASVGVTQVNPALDPQAGTTFTQYRNATRGQYVLPSTSTLDLAITHNWELFKVRSTPVNAFVKFVAFNVLNHQQLIGFNTVSNDALDSSSTGNAADDTPAAQSQAWVRGATYGSTSSSSYWATARSYSIDFGIRF